MIDTFEETDEQEERRLEREARTVCLGTLWHPDCKRDGSDSCAKVEVTYGDRYARYFGDAWGKTLQNSGHYIVHVPTHAPTGDDSYDMEIHPATLAENVVSELAHDHDYWSIDDIGSH